MFLAGAQPRTVARMARDRVHVNFRKYPDTKYWQYDLTLMGEDDYGRWLWGPAGTPAQRTDEPVRTLEQTMVKLVGNEWWAAMWFAAGEPELYVDIIAPAVWEDGRVTMIDLDLDVVRRRDGSVYIDDEDEFAEHQVSLQYPQALIDGALAATERVQGMLARNDEPFATIGPARLAAAIACAERN